MMLVTLYCLGLLEHDCRSIYLFLFKLLQGLISENLHVYQITINRDILILLLTCMCHKSLPRYYLRLFTNEMNLI